MTRSAPASSAAVIKNAGSLRRLPSLSLSHTMLWLFVLPDEPEVRCIWEDRLPIDHNRNRPKSPRAFLPLRQGRLRAPPAADHQTVQRSPPQDWNTTFLCCPHKRCTACVKKRGQAALAIQNGSGSGHYESFWQCGAIVHTPEPFRKAPWNWYVQ